jgi:hypothetical protein
VWTLLVVGARVEREVGVEVAAVEAKEVVVVRAAQEHEQSAGTQHPLASILCRLQLKQSQTALGY